MGEKLGKKVEYKIEWGSGGVIFGERSTESMMIYRQN